MIAYNELLVEDVTLLEAIPGDKGYDVDAIREDLDVVASTR